MWIRYVSVVLVVTGLNATRASAASITVDEILHASGVNGALLSRGVTMSLSGSTLAITLQNTSQDLAGSGAGVLLTGLGFQLPSGVMIQGGWAYASTKGDVSHQWGYDNDPLDSGAFKNAAFLDYSTVVGSMTSIATTAFTGGHNLRGPDYGLASALTNSFVPIQAGHVAVSFGSPTRTTVPEPGSLSLVGAGLTSVAVLLRRKRNRESRASRC